VGKLYERYAHLVLGLCVKYLHDVPQAEDATCDIFMSLFDKLKQHDIQHFRSWIYSTARNHCLMILRSSKRMQAIPIDDRLEDSSRPELDLVVEREERLDLLEEAMTQLAEPQRQAVQLFYLERKSYLEIASQTESSLKQVKSHLQNAKRNLSIILSQHDTFKHGT